MSRTITRLYESQQSAVAAGRDLMGLGLPGEQISLLVHREAPSRSPGVRASVADDAGSADAIVAELQQIGLDEPEARKYAGRILDGCVLLSVRTPDPAQEVVQIMERHGPVALAADDRAVARAPGDDGDTDPAPLSHLLHIPVLSDDPAPLSHLLHIPVLAED